MIVECPALDGETGCRKNPVLGLVMNEQGYVKVVFTTVERRRGNPAGYTATRGRGESDVLAVHNRITDNKTNIMLIANACCETGGYLIGVPVFDCQGNEQVFADLRNGSPVRSGYGDFADQDVSPARSVMSL